MRVWLVACLLWMGALLSTGAQGAAAQDVAAPDVVGDAATEAPAATGAVPYEGPTLAEVEAILGKVRTPGPGEILIGAYVNDVQHIDLVTHSYPGDIYVWFRWTDPELDPMATYEFMNFYDPEAHIESVLYDAPQPMPDGSFYNIIRHQGAFSAPMPLARYPFDTQEIRFILEDAEHGAEAVNYIPDPSGFTANSAISLPGYRVGKPELRIYPKSYPTIFGDLTNPETGAYSRVEFVLPISRPWQTGIIKLILPVVIVLVCAGLALAIQPDYSDARIGLVITALLTLVALQITTGSSLPDVGYLMLIDQIYILCYAAILIVLIRVVRGTWRTDADDDVRDSRRDLRLLAAVSVVFLSALAFMVGSALIQEHREVTARQATTLVADAPPTLPGAARAGQQVP